MYILQRWCEINWMLFLEAARDSFLTDFTNLCVLPTPYTKSQKFPLYIRVYGGVGYLLCLHHPYIVTDCLNPIGLRLFQFVYIFDNKWLKLWDIIDQSIPKSFLANLIVFVNKIMTHTFDNFPWNFWMGFNKIIG